MNLPVPDEVRGLCEGLSAFLAPVRPVPEVRSPPVELHVVAAEEGLGALGAGVGPDEVVVAADVDLKKSQGIVRMNKTHKWLWRVQFLEKKLVAFSIKK